MDPTTFPPEWIAANSGHPCKALMVDEHLHRSRCGKVDHQKPMVFRGTDWCCTNHEKLVEAQKEEG